MVTNTIAARLELVVENAEEGLARRPGVLENGPGFPGVVFNAVGVGKIRIFRRSDRYQYFNTVYRNENNYNVLQSKNKQS